MLGGKTFFLCHLFIFMKKLETGKTITLQLDIDSFIKLYGISMLRAFFDFPLITM